MTDHNHFFHSSNDHGLGQHDLDSEHIPRSSENVFGGETFVKDGHVVAETRANDRGGYEVYRDGDHVLHTEQNIFGGQDISHGSHFLGHTSPNTHDGINLTHNGYPLVSTHPEGNGLTAVMTHEDPLLHTSDYHMTPLDLLAVDIVPH